MKETTKTLNLLKFGREINRLIVKKILFQARETTVFDDMTDEEWIQCLHAFMELGEAAQPLVNIEKRMIENASALDE